VVAFALMSDWVRKPRIATVPTAPTAAATNIIVRKPPPTLVAKRAFLSGVSNLDIVSPNTFNE